jgi:hypothetical protein
LKTSHYDKQYREDEMVTTLFSSETEIVVCKHLPELPPVVSEWQQNCQQPHCSHFCDGECFHPDRHSMFACPFDGGELLLEVVDAED